MARLPQDSKPQNQQVSGCTPMP